MTTALEMNTQLLQSAGQGITAGAEAFALAIERRRQLKSSGDAASAEVWENFAKELGDKVVSLSDELQSAKQTIAAQGEEIRSKDEQLRAVVVRVDTYRAQSIAHAEYVDLLVQRLDRANDILQRQSATSHALVQLKDLMVDEMAKVQDPAQLTTLDPKLRREVLDKAWGEYMATFNVKVPVPARPKI